MLILLTAFAALGAPSGAAAQGPTPVFRYAEDRAPSTLNPAYASNMVDTRVNELLFQGLFTYDRFLNPVPALAKSIEVSEDHRSAKVSIGEHKWHDGKPVTPADVVFSFHAIMNPKSRAVARVGLLGIQDVRIVGPRDVLVVFKKPVVQPERLLMFKILPRHKLTDPLLVADRFRSHPLGNGLYKFSELEGTSLHLRAAGPMKAGGLTAVEARFIPDKRVQLDFLQYEALDAVVRILPKHRPVVKALKGKFELRPYESLSWWYIGINHKNRALAEPGVRRAIAQALDRDELRSAHLGDGQTISGPFAPRSPFYNESVKPLPYNLRAARKLMEGAGYKRRRGRFAKGKRRLKLRMVVNKDWSMYKDVCLDIQTRLQKAGFEIELEWLDAASWRQKVIKDKNFDLSIGAWSFDEASDVYPLFHSKGEKNYFGYKNARMDALLEQSKKTQDPELFREIYFRVHALAHEDLPYVFLWSVNSYTAISSQLEGVDIHPFRYFTWIKDWSWRADKK